MSTKNFNKKVWAATILRSVESKLVAKKICNTDYTGEIKKGGDAVYFNGLADPTIFKYTGADITYEGLEDSRVTLLVDQQDAFAFKVADIEQAQAIYNDLLVKYPGSIYVADARKRYRRLRGDFIN